MLQLSRGQALFPEAQGAATPEAWFPHPSSHSCSWQSLPITRPQKLFFVLSAGSQYPLPSDKGLGKIERGFPSRTVP